MSPLRSRLAQAVILVVACGAMAAPPLIRHFAKHGDALPDPPSADVPLDRQFEGIDPNKDYTLWYRVGRQVVNGGDLYRTTPGQPFPFMYPPFAAVLLAALSLLGPTGMIVCLVLLNAACVAAVAELSVRLAAGTADVPLWVRVVPAALCVFFLNDMFLLGQPNLGLLALVLGGLALVRAGKGWAAGALFAVATAIKAFPAVIVVYLLWRRQWAAATSMVLFTAAFLVLVPAPVRGFERNLRELKQWADGMLLRDGEDGHGQRPEQSVGWRNQSVFGVGGRLLRPGNALAEEARNAEDPSIRRTVNVVDLGYRGATAGTLVAAGLLGLGFVLVMPRRAARTRQTDAVEYGLLAVLVIVGPPYAFVYYFVWLVYPFTVLVERAGTAPARTDRIAAWATLGVTAALMAVGGVAQAVYDDPLPFACGSMFWAAMTTLAGLAWQMLRVRREQVVTAPWGGRSLP